MNTEVGKIASLLKTTSEKKTPLQVNLDQFGQKLSILILVFCAILFGISVFRGENIGNAFLFCSSSCSCSNSGGVKFNRYDRSFFWNAENGERTCNCSKTTGSRRTGKCIHYLFR